MNKIVQSNLETGCVATLGGIAIADNRSTVFAR